MKKLMLILIAVMMTAPAYSYTQEEMKTIESLEVLSQEQGLDLDALSTESLLEINAFVNNKRFRCVAENRRGIQFKAEADNRKNARRKAMHKCRENSKRPQTCAIVSCQKKNDNFQNFLDLIELLDQLANK